MPKSSAKTLATAPLDLLYHSAADMPWDVIEAKMHRSFSGRDRSGIFRCTFCYSVHRGFVRDAAPAAEVETIRQQFLGHAQGLIDLADKYRPVTGPRCSEADETVFMALAGSITKVGFGLTPALRDAASACQPIIDALADNQVNYVQTSQNPEVIGLANFIAEAIKGATPTAASSNPGYTKNPKAFVYHRWGLHLSPQHGDLPALATAVLGREVKQGQVQHAFKVAHEQNLIP